jgi:hypothetical protein
MSCIIVPLDGSAGFIGMGTWQSTSLTAKTAITALQTGLDLGMKKP